MKKKRNKCKVNSVVVRLNPFSTARFTDQRLLQGHDGAVQLALHADNLLRHRSHVELKPGQLSLVILQVGLQHTATDTIDFYLNPELYTVENVPQVQHIVNKMSITTCSISSMTSQPTNQPTLIQSRYPRRDIWPC